MFRMRSHASTSEVGPRALASSAVAIGRPKPPVIRIATRHGLSIVKLCVAHGPPAGHVQQEARAPTVLCHERGQLKTPMGHSERPFNSHYFYSQMSPHDAPSHNVGEFQPTWQHKSNQFRGSIVVSVSACHAEGPRSIPGRGVFAFRSQFSRRGPVCNLVNESPP